MKLTMTKIRRPKLALTVLTILAPLAIGPAAAQPAPSAGGERAAESARASSLGMAEAIAIAERHAGAGARAVEAEYEEARGQRAARYEVKVLHPDGRLVEHVVDAARGQVTESDERRLRGLFARIGIGDVQGMRMTLAEAVTMAERHLGPGARAVEAEIEREGRALGFEIDVATADRTREVKIGADGRIRVDD